MHTLTPNEVGAFCINKSLLQHIQYTCGPELSQYRDPSLPTNQMCDISAVQLNLIINISIQLKSGVVLCINLTSNIICCLSKQIHLPKIGDNE